MAKQLWFLSSSRASAHRGTNSAKLNGVASWWEPYALGEARNPVFNLLTSITTPVAGPTNGIEYTLSGLPIEFISEPLSADFTIAGTITANLYGSEGDMNTNAAINFVVEKIDGATGALTQIVKSARVTELTTSSAFSNFTAAPTSTACKRGDRLRVRVFIDDAGTMAALATADFSFGTNVAAGSGDSWIQFTENLTFETVAPTGSTYYLTDTAETINPGAATEKKALTTRGGGSVTVAASTAAGPTTGIQI